MESLDDKDLLESVRQFIGKDEPEDTEGKSSLIARSQCSVVLLRSLPTVRSAVLEQIGNIFEELAHSYIVEAERHLLTGQHLLTDIKDPALDDLVTSVQATLNEFVECNTKAWASQIVKWSVTVLGRISGQYGIYREFSKLNIDGRLQLWMNCSATRLLLEISVGCFSHVVNDNASVVVKDLICTASEQNPYFDWVLVQYCCSFPKVLPGKLLLYALQEFSLQTRDAEVVINMTMRVFSKLAKQHADTLEDAVLKLFSESIMPKERTKDQAHIADCTIPFLLHVGKLCSVLVDGTAEKFLNMMNAETLAVLRMQADRRDKVLQKGMSSRVLEMITKMGGGSFKVIQFLINFSCGNEPVPGLTHELLMDVRKACRELLEALSLKLHNHSHQRFVTSQRNETGVPVLPDEFVLESPFLKDLQQFSKQLCSQYFNAVGLRQKVLAQFLVLCGIGGGKEKMTEILTHVLVIMRPTTASVFVRSLQVEFEVFHDNVMVEVIHNLVSSFTSQSQNFTVPQICRILSTFVTLVEEELSTNLSGKSRVIDCLQKEWKRLLLLLNLNDMELSEVILSILEMLKVPGAENPVSEVFVMTNMIVAFYMNCMKKLLRSQEDKRLFGILGRSEDIIFKIIKENMILQQSVIRSFVENMFVAKDSEESDVSMPVNKGGSEDSLRSSHMRLIDENASPEVVSRLPLNTVSVMYAGSLNRHDKRKLEEFEEASGPSRQFLFQLLYNFLVGLLNPDSATRDDIPERVKPFADLWLDRKTGPRYPSSHAFLASLLSEIVCPDVHPMLPWPDEDFLKYTIERNLRIKRHFERNPLLWQCIDLISQARPALCHCSTIIQSLYAYCLMYWQVERSPDPKTSLPQLKLSRKIFEVMDNAGWLPYPMSAVADIFEFIKPKEIYQIMSHIWRFCTENAFVVERFTSRDRFGQPCISFPPETVTRLRGVLQQIFYSNIETLGVFYSRYMTVEAVS